MLELSGNSPNNSELLGNSIPNTVINAAAYTAQKYSLPFTGILSTWALESRWGKSGLVAKTNNPFNIKGCSGYLVTGCHKAYDKIEKSYDSYRKYATLQDGFDAYGYLITDPNGRYKVSGLYVNDPIGFFTHLKAKGYATDKKYISKLTGILKKIVKIVDKGLYSSNTAMLQKGNKKHLTTDNKTAKNSTKISEPVTFSKDLILPAIAAVITVSAVALFSSKKG